MLRNKLFPLKTTRGSTSAGMAVKRFQKSWNSFPEFISQGGQLSPDYPPLILKIQSYTYQLLRPQENSSSKS